tara:strand:- start:2867 stop:4087 length:1221 start_codon:yes stop_codon:yes gene_type:complete
MSKTPLKQADSTLVQGAYNAAAAGIPRDGQDGMAQGMDKLMEISGQAVKDIAAARAEKQKEGNELADGILDTGGSLGTSWLTACQGEVKNMHGDYKKAAAFGRKNKTAKGMQDLNGLSAEIASIKDLNTDMATWQKEDDWSASVTPKEQEVFNAFMNNDSKKRIVKDENGNRTFEVETPQGWMSTKDIERMANDHKKDYTTMTEVRKQALNIKESAAEEVKKNLESNGAYAPEQFTPEYEAKLMSKFDNTLRNGNLKSLMHDDILENGKPFVDALRESPDLTNMTYEELGINPSMNSQQGAYRKLPEGQGPSNTIDLDGDGKISQEEFNYLSDQDKELIIDAMTNPDNENYNEERTRAEMSKYFTKFTMKNFTDEYERNGGKYQGDAGDESMSDADFIKKYSTTTK